MKKLILLVFCLNIYVSQAQIDNPTAPTKAPGELMAPKTGSESSSFKKTSGNHSLSTKKGILGTQSESMKLGEKEEKSFSMRTDQNGLMTFKGKDFTPKAFTKDKEAREEFRRDQYLGDFKTTGVFVELYCRDHEYVDGDKVKVTVNGVVIDRNMSLGGTFTPIMVKLDSGLNNIEFEALNQGTSGPNTAELRVYDDQGREVARKEWNLLTGSKASLVVVKQ
ncbi:hypothetical protein JRG66_14620 [Salinimicrobium tongyeongense]|jgi:hypothetical protein|uniref:Secreted protein n=1 Tax=Salinimicrobium tongyeongense TaxID=2809707 RepID=A0ABY6NQJ3_9FLAO|nr:hypothetical protein [Salinimicrobium tongyeongense]UZH55167.1 hypothetical protein JRG66_14620 [Salinimicrobium tongyeongense]